MCHIRDAVDGDDYKQCCVVGCDTDRDSVWEKRAAGMKSHKTVNVHVTSAVRCVWANMLQWKSNKYYIFWVSVCGLNYQARTVPQSVLCLCLQYFPTLSHKQHNFERKKKITKCVFWFSIQLLCEIFLILRRTGRDIIVHSCCRSCAALILLLRLKWNFSFLDKYPKNTTTSHFVVADLLNADRQMERCDLGNSCF